MSRIRVRCRCLAAPFPWFMNFCLALWKFCQPPSALTKVTGADTQRLPGQNRGVKLAVNPPGLGILNLSSKKRKRPPCRRPFSCNQPWLPHPCPLALFERTGWEAIERLAQTRATQAFQRKGRSECLSGGDEKRWGSSPGNQVAETNPLKKMKKNLLSPRTESIAVPASPPLPPSSRRSGDSLPAAGAGLRREGAHHRKSKTLKTTHFS